MMQTTVEAKRSDSDLVRTEHLVLTFVRSNLIEGATYTFTKNSLRRYL